MSFSKEKLDTLKVGDIVQGECGFMIKEFNKYCGKSFKLIKKEESCVFDYGWSESINKYTFAEVDANNNIKKNGINFTTDDFWTSYIGKV